MTLARYTLQMDPKYSPKVLAAALVDPECAAEAADLVYVSDDGPGITRRKFGKGFAYYAPGGKKIGDAKVVERINKLAIPPAYADVWICPDPAGHLQATGRDDRGRKQYRYHERWAEVRDAAKFGKMIQFAEALPSLRRKVEKHLKLPGLPREKVLAACVKLLDVLYIRVGNEEYATQNDSYGLTTLQDDHAEIKRGVLHLEFAGKHGVEREIDLKDKRLAEIVKQCQDLPGQELLQYLDDDGNVVDVGSGDVNAYLHEHAGDGFSAKDFRTWHATVLAATALRDEVPAEAKTARNKQIVAAVDHVAAALGNTRAVCRKCYIHPAAMDSFDTGKLKALMEDAEPARGLSKDEAATLKLLRSL